MTDLDRYAGLWTGFLVCSALSVAVAAPAAAQTGAVVEGQVYDRGSGAGIENAVVTLQGHGAELTAVGGLFRFERVAPGAYTLQVDGFGYASESRVLVVDGNTTVSVSLEIAPLPLDSLVVSPRLIEVRGSVRDPTRDLDVVDADIISDPAQGVRTDAHGGFELEDVFAGTPLRIVVQAFGYLPLDTSIVPEADVDLVFHLEPDTVVEHLVAAQVERIEERASPRRSVLMRPMNRERLLRYAGRLTLADLLEWEYGGSWLKRVECVVIDERQLLGAWEPSSLTHILPEQVERIEFLGHAGAIGRDAGSMLRIYTREFMRAMITRNVELRAPTLSGRRVHAHGIPAICR
jgi:hypothetical protein